MKNPAFNSAMCLILRRPIIVFPAWHPGRAIFRHNDFHAGDFADVEALAENLNAQRLACVRPENVTLPDGWVLSRY